MELWIRSQNKEMLYKVDEINLYYEICDELGIKNYYVEINHEPFGIYKTKERALEVLDEIQRTITKQLVNRHKQIDGNYSFEVIDTAIYEMPKE